MGAAELYILNRLPKEGMSPLNAEEIILCILSFRTVQYTVVEVEEDAELGSVTICDGVSISMRQTKEGVNSSLSVPYPLRPIHVSLHFCCFDDRAMEASVSNCGDG